MELLKRITQISNYEPSSGLKKELYKLVVQENYTREQAKEYFKSSKNNPNFRVVYKNLKDSLLDGVLTTSLHNLPKLNKGRLQVWKKQLQYRILKELKSVESGIKLAIETIVIAEQNEQFDTVQAICRDLLLYFSTTLPNTKNYKKYRQKYTLSKRYADDEAKAQIIYTDLWFCYISRKTTLQFSREIEELEKIAASNQNYRFRYFYYSIKSLFFALTNENYQLVDNNKNAYHFFDKSNQALHYVTKYKFIADSIPYYLIQNQFAEAESTINTAITLPPEGSHNWHKILIYQALLGFYSHKPRISLSAYKRAAPSIKKIKSEVIREKWHIVQGYLAIYQKLGLLQEEVPFKLARWKNIKEKRDNRPQKANLLVVELMYYLVNEQHDKYLQRKDSIESFISTHFKAHKYKRTRYFLRMLKTVVRGNFRSEYISKYAAKQFSNLKTAHKEITSEDVEIEMIPYETLWAHLMDFYSPQKRK